MYRTNTNMICREYLRWKELADDTDIRNELAGMDEKAVEDAFYRDLTFGTGGLRGIIGAGTNRMNIYVVSKATQGISDYLGPGKSVVIGYDSRIKSDLFARTAACVFAANGITVNIWPRLEPVPAVSYAVRYLHADMGIMITASHNPAIYNGYKVYGPDGCQITTGTAGEILSHISHLDIFDDIRTMDFGSAVSAGQIRYIPDGVLDSYIDEVRSQSVLFGDDIRRDISIVYSPLNGTGLIPVTRALSGAGFTGITVVEEQKLPDGDFPTCPYPNPEVREAMELGLKYCERIGADLLIATDPDADRCGIAVRDGSSYRLLSGNEVGLLLLDFVCSQRIKHGRMPSDPVFVKTIVTMDLAEKIADRYDVETVNVLTGFKYIGEVIGRLESSGRKQDFILGFEESYGYLTGSYVRDKDGVNASLMISEMFAYYMTRGISLIDKLNEIYGAYGYCLNTLHSYVFEGPSGMTGMKSIMDGFRSGLQDIGGYRVIRTEDYGKGLNGLPASDVLKFFLDCGSVVVRPSGTEPKLKAYISVVAENSGEADMIERKITAEMERFINGKDSD